MEQKKRRNRGEWEQIVKEQAESGYSAKKFCQERAIGLASFYQWRRRMKGLASASKTGIESTGAFIDMGKINPEKVPAETNQSAWMVTLDLGAGLRLELRRT